MQQFGISMGVPIQEIYDHSVKTGKNTNDLRNKILELTIAEQQKLFTSPSNTKRRKKVQISLDTVATLNCNPTSANPLRRADSGKPFYCPVPDTEIESSSDDNIIIGVYNKYTPTNIVNKESGLFMISQEVTKEKVDFGPKPDFISKLQGLEENNHIRCIQTLCTLMNVSIIIKQIMTIPGIKNLNNYVLNDVNKFLGNHEITIDLISPKISFEDLFSCHNLIPAPILIVAQGHVHYKGKKTVDIKHWTLNPF